MSDRERAPLALRLAIPGCLLWLAATGAWFEWRLRAVGTPREGLALWIFGAPWSAILAAASVALLLLAARREPRARTGILAFAAVVLVFRFTLLPNLLAFLGYGDFGELFAPLAPILAPLARELLIESLADMLYAAALVALTMRGDVLEWTARRAW